MLFIEPSQAVFYKKKFQNTFLLPINSLISKEEKRKKRRLARTIWSSQYNLLPRLLCSILKKKKKATFMWHVRIIFHVCFIRKTYYLPPKRSNCHSKISSKCKIPSFGKSFYCSFMIQYYH